MIEYGGSTGKRHCRRLASREPEFTTSNIIHLHPKEHVDDQRAEQNQTIIDTIRIALSISTKEDDIQYSKKAYTVLQRKMCIT